MRWRGGRRSSNVEDRRRMRVSRKAAGGGIGTIVLVLVALYFGVDPSLMMQSTGTRQMQTEQVNVQFSAEEQELAEFVSVILADTEDTWREIFRQSGSQYQEPRLVLFSGAVDSACGLGQAATGPFYCPADQKVYIDLSFYRQLRERFKAPGDFAQAYVIAHEIGHHVQTLIGVSQKVHQARSRMSRAQANALSVRQELQADCFAGIWANHAHRARQLLEEGDIEEGLNAANAIGDDQMQRHAGRRVSPDSFTHGSSEQRVRWFKVGLKTGSVDSCNTFEADRL